MTEMWGTVAEQSRARQMSSGQHARGSRTRVGSMEFQQLAKEVACA